MALYKNTTAQVKTNDGQSDPFDITAGVLQGDTLAPFIFVIIVDYIIRMAEQEVGEQKGFTIHRRQSSRRPASYLTDLAFADDIALLSDNTEDGQLLLNSVEHFALSVGLRINRKKTEYMLVGLKEPRPDNQLSISEGKIEKAEDFKYLGGWVKSSEKDVNVRIALAFDAINKLKNVWTSSCSAEVKMKIFKTIVQSILLYNSETWTLTKKLASRLDGCYTRLIRRVKNIKYDQHITNETLYQDIPKISCTIRKRRLQFLGHCIRSNQPVSQLAVWEADGPMRVGQGNRLTYIKQIKRDLPQLDLKDIVAMAANRNTWKELVTNL